MRLATVLSSLVIVLLGLSIVNRPFKFHASNVATPPLPTPSQALPCLRAFYIDGGANWANTLSLFRSIPGPKHACWNVYAFEASPPYFPFLSSAIDALNRGDKAPEPPLPPTGSSKDLVAAGPKYGCSIGGKAGIKECMLQQFGDVASRLNTQSMKFSTREVWDRLRRPTNQYSSSSAAFNFIPAAVGTTNGTATFFQTDVSLLIGGANIENIARKAHLDHDQRYEVDMIDLPTWLKVTLDPWDWVVLKLDVEGAEFGIVEKIIDVGADVVIDYVMLECHPKGGNCDKLMDKIRRSKMNLLPFH